MTNLRKYLLLIFFIGVLAASAGAQVRFDVYSNPYSGPGIAVSVGRNSGYCQQPVYNSGYVVYPTNGAYNRGVVVAPYYNNGYYNQGYYNNGYYSNGNCNNNGYYENNGYYNTGYANPGYGNYNRGYNNRGYNTRYNNSRSRRCR